MSDMKHEIEHLSHSSGEHQAIQRQLTTVTLTAEQFESMYLQPRDSRMNNTLTSRVGNPTPLSVPVTFCDSSTSHEPWKMTQ